MGAFLAGAAVGIRTSVISLKRISNRSGGLCSGCFFLAVGMSLDVATVLNNWKVILSATVLMIILKCFAIYGWRVLPKQAITPRYTAPTDVAGGEFAFVLLASAAAQQAINAEVLANMTAIVVLSMIMTPFSVMLFDRYFKESRAAAAVDDVEEHAGELNGNADLSDSGAWGRWSANAANLQCHHFHSGQRSGHHQRRTRNTVSKSITAKPPAPTCCILAVEHTTS